MPLYFGHKNNKGLSVSPSLQSLKIDLLRAAPSSVNVIGRPTVTQPGYAAYLNHLPAFMKAYVERKAIKLTSQGYVANYPIDHIIPLTPPPLVIDYNGPPPAKHVEDLSKIGFERIKMQRNDNILRFPAPTYPQVRTIKGTSPNSKTPAPVNAVNIEAFDTWVLVLRLISNLLATHIYPAFRDDGHFMEEIEGMVDELMVQKRKDAPEDTQNSTVQKKQKDNEGNPIPSTEDVDMDKQDTEPAPKDDETNLHKAKPPRTMELPWGTQDVIPNASGLFFPYIPELASYDDTTVPRLFEDYLLQSLGNTPEQQLERYSRIKSAWGLISRTDSGNAVAHLVRVILLSLTSQTRTFPIIQDGIYQGSVMSGGRFFIGLNGQIHRPLPFDKLQVETGSYHMHSRVLEQIACIAHGLELGDDHDENDKRKIRSITSTISVRHLRSVLMKKDLSESDRDEIRKLAVHLRYKNDSCLAVNPQTISRVLESMTEHEEKEDIKLPLHHSALFSRDKIFASLAAFGFQAPSFSLENCPKVNLRDSKPPTTLVIRQKTLEVATLDWRSMVETQEIRNNPRNLSRANRDRTITANDKTMIWGKLRNACGVLGNEPNQDKIDNVGFVVDTRDGLDDW